MGVAQSVQPALLNRHRGVRRDDGEVGDAHGAGDSGAPLLLQRRRGAQSGTGGGELSSAAGPTIRGPVSPELEVPVAVVYVLAVGTKEYPR